MLLPVPYDNFAGGLRLLDQAAELDSDRALDLADIRVGERGGIENRPGSERWSESAGAAMYNSLFWSRAGTDCLLGGVADTVRAITASGVNDDVTAALGNEGPFSFAGFGAPTQELVFIANGSDLVRWDGAAFTVNDAVTVDEVGAQAAPRPNVVVVTPWDNRLVAAGYRANNLGPDGGASSGSHIYFSDQGDPDTWSLLWRELFAPGDGEEIVAGCVWRDRVFLFKQTKFMVITGTSDSGGGAPVLDYYQVDTGVGAHSVIGVCAGRDGVYFCDQGGIYRTQGEEAVPVSWEIEPLFRGRAAPFFTGELLDRTAIDEVALAAVNELVYVSYPTAGGERRTLVFDPRIDWWGYDTLRAGAMVRVPVSGQDEVYFAGEDDYVHRLADGLLDDEDQEVRGFWRSAWQSFGSPGPKIVRQSQVWGQGRVRLSYSGDFRSLEHGGDLRLSPVTDTWGDGSEPGDVWAEGDDPSDLWATGGGFSDDWARYAVQADYHSWELRALEAQVSVQRLEHHLLVVRAAETDIRATGG